MAQVDSRVVSQFLDGNASNISDALDRLGIEGHPPADPTRPLVYEGKLVELPTVKRMQRIASA